MPGELQSVLEPQNSNANFQSVSQDPAEIRDFAFPFSLQLLTNDYLPKADPVYGQAVVFEVTGSKFPQTIKKLIFFNSVILVFLHPFYLSYSPYNTDIVPLAFPHLFSFRT